MTRYEVRVERRACIGSTNCVEEAPEAFEMDDVVAVVRTPLAPDEALLRGAQACPVGAIAVIDRETGRRIWP